GLQAYGQSVTFDFADGQPDGWANSGFGGTPAPTVSNFGGTNFIFLARNPGNPPTTPADFQVGNVSAGNNGSAFYNAMKAAAANPSGYVLSYNWRVDTSTFGANPGTFLQLGAFVNTGSGFYAQDASEVQLSQAQVTSGQVFTGTVSVNMGAVGFNMPAADTFFRLGLIENSDTTDVIGAYFTHISVAPIPEPSSFALFGLALPAFWMMRRRFSGRR